MGELTDQSLEATATDALKQASEGIAADTSLQSITEQPIGHFVDTTAPTLASETQAEVKADTIEPFTAVFGKEKITKGSVAELLTYSYENVHGERDKAA